MQSDRTARHRHFQTQMGRVRPEAYPYTLLCASVCRQPHKAAWHRGRFEGPEPVRLAVLKFASTLGPAYIDVELLAADFFFAGMHLSSSYSSHSCLYCTIFATSNHHNYHALQRCAAKANFFEGSGTVPIGTNVILSHHDYEGTPTDEDLDALVAKMVDSGADIAKIATTATDVSDSMRMLKLPGRHEGKDQIASHCSCCFQSALMLQPCVL